MAGAGNPNSTSRPGLFGDRVPNRVPNPGDPQMAASANTLGSIMGGAARNGMTFQAGEPKRADWFATPQSQPATQAVTINPSVPQQAGAPNVFQQSADAYSQALAAANPANQIQVQPQSYTASSYTPATMQASSYAPAMMGRVDDITAGQLADTDLNPYLNPYTQSVIDTTMSDLNRGRQMAMNDVGASATAARAFGGSRHGLVEAETNRGFGDVVARTSAGLNQANFQQAQQSALTDIMNRLTADRTNQGVDVQRALANQAASNAAGQFNTGAANQASAANMAAQNNAGIFGATANNAAGQFNADAAMRAQALNQAAQGSNISALGSLAGMGFDMGRSINNDMMQQGAMQQALQQQVLNNAQGQFRGETGAPADALNMILAALSGQPNQSSQVQTRNPGLFDYLTAGAELMSGL